MPKTPELTPSALGALCLAYLVEHPSQLGEFMSVAGLSPDALRRAAGTGELDLGLIDYVVQNEPLLLAICANAGLRPDDFMRVWLRLNPAG